MIKRVRGLNHRGGGRRREGLGHRSQTVVRDWGGFRGSIGSEREGRVSVSMGGEEQAVSVKISGSGLIIGILFSRHRWYR